MCKLSEQTNELFTALAKMQGELENASKLKQGYDYKYADLAQCINIAKEPLSKNGLAVSQMLSQSKNNKCTLITILTHSSGQYMMSEFELVDALLAGRAAKNPAQLLGSAITYQRRYAYASILGMAQEDDDASILNNTNQNKSSSSLLTLRNLVKEKGYTDNEIESHIGIKFLELDDSKMNSLICEMRDWSKKII